MGIITRIEDLIGEPLEALFDFHKGTQPVELERFLRKALEKSRVALIGKTFVANAYVIKVNADDFRDYSSLAAELAAQLEQSVHEEVREKSYAAIGPVSVSIVPDRSVGKGKVQVTTQFVKEGAEQEMPASSATTISPVCASGSPVVTTSTTIIPALQQATVAGPATGNVSPASVFPTASSAEMIMALPTSGQGMTRRIRIEGPAGMLEIILSTADIVDLVQPASGRLIVAWGGRTVVVGREGGRTPADIEIEDPGISRPHCSLRIEDGEAIIEDLGSSNGTWVNGERTSLPIILTSADEAVIGATTITVVRPL